MPPVGCLAFSLGMVARVNHRTCTISMGGIHRASVATATAHARAVDAGRMASRELVCITGYCLQSQYFASICIICTYTDAE